MSSDVYFYQGTRELGDDAIKSQVGALSGRVWFGDHIAGGDVLVKLHVGEKHNDGALEVTTHIRRPVVRGLVEKVRENGGVPFLGDSTPVYGFGMRCKPEGHRYVAQAHGFGEDLMLGARFLVLDEPGTVSAPMEGLGKVELPRLFYEIGSKGGYMAVASHLTGHPMTAFGGALKQLGMGCVGETTKRDVHGTYRATVDTDSCTGCETCVDACRDGYITVVAGKAKVGDDCIGCSGCAEVCPSDALSIVERLELGVDKTSRETLYRNLMRAAKGAADVFSGDGRVIYFTDATAVSPHCDCFEIGEPHNDLCPDIGLLASRDPVALDKATLDLMRDAAGGEGALQKALQGQFPKIYMQLPFDYQLQFAEALGLGNIRYNLITL